MPTISEMFIGDIQKQNSEPLSKSDAGWQTGVQLVKMKQEREQHAELLKQKKQELLNVRVENFNKDLQLSNNYKDPKARSNYLTMMKGRRDVWGLQDHFSDEAIDSLKIDEDYGKAVTLAREVNRPGSPFYGRGDLAAAAYNDPVKRATVDTTPSDQWGKEPAESADINKAMKEYNDNKIKEKAAAAAANKGVGTDDRFDTKLLVDLSTKFDAKVAKSKDRLVAAQNIETLLTSKQPISDTAVKTQLARLSGEVGPLSTFDVQTWSGDQSALERAKQYMNMAAAGTLTEGNRKQMREVAATMKKVVQNRIKAEAERTIRLGKNSGRVDEAKLRDSLGVDELIPDNGGATYTLSNGKSYSEAQLNQFLETHKTGKVADEIMILLKKKGQ